MSLGVDFQITQVVDANVGIHSVIPKYAAATVPVLLCLCVHLSGQIVCSAGNKLLIGKSS